MNKTVSQFLGTLAISAAAALLGACGGDSNGGGSAGNSGTDTPEQQAAQGPVEIPVANDFNFPEVVNVNGNYTVTIPDGPAPTFSARRTLENGTGSTIDFGDPVVLNYRMFSWSSGELVESSDTLDEPITVRAGLTDGIPEYLSKSLLGRKLGDRLQIVFESGMDDLPVYLDSNDAYVVVLELI